MLPSQKTTLEESIKCEFFFKILLTNSFSFSDKNELETALNYLNQAALNNLVISFLNF